MAKNQTSNKAGNKKSGRSQVGKVSGTSGSRTSKRSADEGQMEDNQ